MFKLIKFVFWTVIVLLLVVVVGGFVFLKTFDLNTYKAYAEKEVYKLTGRQLALNGDAGLKISLVPTIKLNDVTLSNAVWAAQPYMVKAQSVEVSVSILPLLHKEVVIDTVRLIEPEVYLVVNKDGKNNWTFTAPGVQYAAAESVTMTDAATAEADMPMSFLAKDVQIVNGVVVYEDMQNGSKQDVRVKTFDLKAEDMNSPIHAAFDVLYNGENISGTAVTGSVEALLRNMADFPVQANVKAYGATVGVDAKLNDLLGNNLRFAGSVTAKNPSGNFGAPAVTLEANVNGTPTNVTADIKSLNVAGNVISGQVKADLSKAKPYVNAVLQCPKFDLQTLNTVSQASLSWIGSAQAAEFVPDTALDLSALNLVNADLKATVQKLVVDPNFVIDNVQVNAKVNNGVLNVSPFSLGLGGGTINGTASVNGQQNSVAFEAKGQNMTLQNIWPGFALTDNKSFGISSGGKTDLSVNLSGQGATVRSLVESLNGQIIAIVGESKIQTGSLKYLEGNFVTQLLNTLNIQRKERSMTLQCAVVRTDLKNGVATFPKGIVFNAKDLMVVSDGTVNLQNDKLNLTIHPFNGKVTDTNVMQALSSLIKISGTIENPRLALDNSAVVKNVVGVAAAGPAFLGSQMLLDVDEAPCYTALKNTAYQNMFPAPSGVKAAGQGVYQGASDAISDGVDLLTDTAKGVLNLLSGKKK